MPLKFNMNEIKCVVFDGARYMPKRKERGYACYDCDLFRYCNPSRDYLPKICANTIRYDVYFKRGDGK